MAVALCAACSDNIPTQPPPIYSGPIATETFAGTLAVGGSAFYSFTSPKDGPITLTLTSLQENGEASAAAVNLSVGIPVGRGCGTSSAVSATAGTSAQINITLAGGIYCAFILDPGTLGAAASFPITITHTQ
jgi:hypothetical protein